MTKQEYYDLLVVSAFDGTFPSTNVHSECAYRGPDGKRCAIGLLIPDNRYQPRMEGKTILSDEVSYAYIAPDKTTETDLMRVQSAHDESCATFRMFEDTPTKHNWLNIFFANLRNTDVFHDVNTLECRMQ